MLAQTRPWQLRPSMPDLVAELEHDLGVSRLIATLLTLRGIQGAKAADQWMGKRLQDLHKPGLMKDMTVGAKRLAQAINNRERILIHGDYDVDGSTSASLLALLCRACNHEAIVWIPHRRIDGYGLSDSSLEAVKEHQAQLMITVDCGIADGGWAQKIEAATGCHVIITDHHLPQGYLPTCTAVINPNRPDCPYPDKHLAGVGVAWKLAWATAVELCGTDKVTERLRGFLTSALSLVAVGTVADCAPLDGENRILVHHGLKELARTENLGLRALLTHAGLVENQPTASDVGWKLSPLLNASGRMDSAMANIRLLTARSAEEVTPVLEAIVLGNDERRRITQSLTSDLIAKAESDPGLAARNTLVFAGDGWHQGIVGIVASRLVERFGKPAAVIAIENGLAKGSLRSIAAVHLGEAIDACRPLLKRGGGHAMAAGITLEPDRVDAFRDAFERHVCSRVAPGSLVPRTDYDADAALAELDQDFFNRLETMGPFGTGNREPVIRVSGAAFAGRPRLFGKDGDHLRGPLTDHGGSMRELFAWKAKAIFSVISVPGRRFNLLVRPELNRWRGELSPRLVFVDGHSV
ncbi:MAG: single-stranded-DNA-specific exonuclease RecJ [Planctomycetota bacterium]